MIHYFKRFHGCKVSNSATIAKRVILNSSKVGNYTSINGGCDIAYTEIGNYCSLAKGVIIGSRNHIMNNFTTQDCIYKETGDHHKQYSNIDIDNPLVSIGNDVWIGTGAILMPGVDIGNGAIIGAGSIVTKSIPPYSVVAGNPATMLRKRFSEKVANELEATEWWHLSLEELLIRKTELELIVGYEGPLSYSDKPKL